jgi:hypothetical protein
MLSDHERRTLAKIEVELTASDPGFAQSLAASEVPSRPRYSYLLWVVGMSVAVLILLSLAAGLPGGVFLGAALVLGALTCLLSGSGYGYV